MKHSDVPQQPANHDLLPIYFSCMPAFRFIPVLLPRKSLRENLYLQSVHQYRRRLDQYIEEDLGVNTERERAYYDEWDEAALRDIIQRQRDIQEVGDDDFADSPQLHKPHGALDTLFIRGRHLQISTWVSWTPSSKS